VTMPRLPDGADRFIWTDMSQLRPVTVTPVLLDSESWREWEDRKGGGRGERQQARVSSVRAAIGSVRVPATAKEAVESIAASAATMRMYDVGTGELKDRGTPDEQERLIKGWTKNHKDLLDAIESVDPKVRDAVDAARQHNLDNNPLFRGVVEAFRGEMVVAQREEDNAGEFIGGPFVSVSLNMWSDLALEDGDNALVVTAEPEPAPGDTTQAGSRFTSIIRHEYGHLVESQIGRDRLAASSRAYLKDYHAALTRYNEERDPAQPYDFPFDALGWHRAYDSEHPSILREFEGIAQRMGPQRIKDELSYYAGEDFQMRNANTREVFAEAFTAWTNPSLKREKFSDDVRQMFGWFDKHLTRYERP